MLIFVVIVGIVFFITSSVWYLMSISSKRCHSYLNIKQFSELAAIIGSQCKNSEADHDDDGENRVVKDMFMNCPFYRSNHIQSDFDYIQLYQYIHDFCCNKSLYTNRPGPVCPFLPVAFKKDCIYFFDDIYSANKQQLIQTVRRCRHDFLSMLKPTEYEDRSLVVYKCLIILVRSTSISHRLIDQVEIELKPEFVLKYGLMLGEFHLSSNSPAIKNQDFYPLRTQVPLLVIRYLVANDILFLNQKDRYSEDLRLNFIKTYFDLKKKGLLHSTKDHHLSIAKEIFNELNNKNKK
ncbi:unnamed protein product [Adineta ricciae]|uniref:DUF6875 domain-containing protein n=1 Tax=Adineta ricciae TaxID=249248 RepID=A0A814DVG9_ADIRI|nr:unnamed protein product [Adineta ricciae]